MGSVRVVHLVTKNHLDLGFTALATEVADHYVDSAFPQAMATAGTLRRYPDGPQLVWTTGAWMLQHALDAATDESVADGIRRGELAWHALPFTTHTELGDAALFSSGLGISAGLDQRFGRRTTAAKLTDVPGHTRAMVPLLAEAGVTFLHIGVNPAWPVPDVPPVFCWRSPDGAEVVVAYGVGGYGGDVVVDGCDEALAFLHAGDNLGPPAADEVVEAHRTLAERYPGAVIRGSTLDVFARALAASGAATALPVVTAEIGDPWLFGTGSDPVKVAAFREALRSPDRDDGALLPVIEHTWGLDQKLTLGDDRRWDRAGLAELRASPEGRRFEASWDEQRAYLGDLSAFDDGGVTAWPLDADGVPEGGFVPLAPGATVGGAGWLLGVDPDTGALDHLVHVADGRVLADGDHPLGHLGYQTFDEADYERYFADLTPSEADLGWARLDNTKPGIDASGARSARWAPQVIGTWHASQQRGQWHTVLIRVAFPAEASSVFGAPPEIWVRWAWHQSAPDIEAEVWWTDKPASRLPEALWSSFVPRVSEPDRWQIDKLGQAISPLDVVARGGRALHAVGEGLSYDGSDGSLVLRSLDAPLVSPGRLGLLDANPPLPDLTRGFGVLLANNCWGTNFPMWVEGPARFRFSLSLC